MYMTKSRFTHLALITIFFKIYDKKQVEKILLENN